jgi:Ca2+-binding RTX toxin-like protein
MLSRRGAGALVVALTLAASLVVIAPAAHAARPKCFGKRATIVGTKRSDTIRGTRGADVIVARGGADRILGRGGNDRICAGRGRDRVSGGGRNDRVAGGRGSDAVLGGRGRDRIFLEGGGEEFASGGSGNDVIDLGPGLFQFAVGGRGDFSFDFSGYANAPSGVTVDLPAGQATGGHGTDTLISIEGAEGSNFDDTLIGTPGSNFLFGLDGNDTLESNGNAGDLDSPDTVLEMRFDLMSGDAGDDSITGGAGLNVIVHDLAPDGVSVDLQAGTATGDGDDTLTGIQAVLGTRFDDTLRGDNEDNLFEGEGGTDTIDGRAGSDTLVLIDADGEGSADVDLEAGTATATYRPFDPATGQPGDPVPFVASLTAIENVWGSGGDDAIQGDAGPNRLFGFFGDDTVSGRGGDDFIDGGEGTDVLDGGDGDDTCVNGETVDPSCESTTGTASLLGRTSLSGFRMPTAFRSAFRF